MSSEEFPLDREEAFLMDRGMQAYASMAAKFSKVDAPAARRIHALLGVAGEAGEVCQEACKAIRAGREPDLDAIREELGDVLWYVAEVADAFGLSLADIARENITKLLLRHGRR
jgi:NTP pyrophosphatase (non-canonical NTP hydrolase)